AGPDVGARAVLHHISLRQALWAEDVALLAVGVVQQRDPRRPVRVVLHVSHPRRHPVLVGPAEVDQAVGTLVAAALMPRGDPPMHIPAATGMQRADERLLGLAAGDLGEVRAARPTPARRDRLVLADAHVCSSSCRYGHAPSGCLADWPAEDVDTVTLGQADDGALGVGPLPPAEPGAAALAWPVEGVDASYPDIEDRLDRLLDLGLVGALGDDEGIPALVGQAVALLRDHRADQDVSRVGDLAHSCSSFVPAGPLEVAARRRAAGRCLVARPGCASAASAASASAFGLAAALA